MSSSASTDSLIVTEDWISEHYFTTEAKKESFQARVAERRKEWDEAQDRETTRTRILGAKQELLKAFANISELDAEEVVVLNNHITELLGYESVGLAHETRGPVRFIRRSGLNDPVVALISAVSSETPEDLLEKHSATLTEPFEQEDGSQLESVARTLSALFVADGERPDFALVIAGPHLILAEQERWAEGRYLAVDLQLVLERSDLRKAGELDRALTCIDAASIAPDAEGSIWWQTTLEESIAHTVGVSADLREGVRLSIEDIANEVVARREAQGFEPLAADQAQALANQSLRFLYRILFLLYAEASPELGVLPTGTAEYEAGYSMDRLRDLTLVDLSSAQAQDGAHLYESLAVLFRLIDEGFSPKVDEEQAIQGLTFRSLRADLFRPEATELIDEVGLGNEAVQQVLQRLLLSKASATRGRGFISYAELGINQLGAVYEGLMSYTGFFAEEDLYEVAKNGDASKGSWVVPVDRAGGIAEEDFVRSTDLTTGESKPVLHRRGTFVYRLAGRERQQSASYYTPEVLTRFVVSQALEELLDQDGELTSAEEMLQLTICEPALGSGAFAIEAVRQLAERYLERRQEEVDKRIDPDEYPRELQRVKAFIALHQVYGVDLNATAVELAEISLWLDTMVEGLEAPWFGLHLRRGNSLIGALKAVYSREQVNSKEWLKATPSHVGEAEGNPRKVSGSIPHFLLPAEGWGAAAEVEKSIRDLAPNEAKYLKEWRRKARSKPSKKQVDALIDMGHRVERLWELATRRLAIAESQIRRDLPIWELPQSLAVTSQSDRPVSREEIEASLADPNGSYQRLRRIMNAWCALWFWPITVTDTKPPSNEEWFEAIQALLGVERHKSDKNKEQLQLSEQVDWDELDALEDLECALSGAQDIEQVLARHPWLEICETIASEQAFFHWDLDFASVFKHDGFDLQVGNPPWWRPVFDQEALLAEDDPWWQIAVKKSQDQKTARRELAIASGDMQELLTSEASRMAAISSFLSWTGAYPNLTRLQPDTYRCFMERTWRNARSDGVVGLIHPESHFTDENAAVLRRAAYTRLRRHWQFINELTLFEVSHLQTYGVHIYSSPSNVAFLAAHCLYHPETVIRSLSHDGSGIEPGIKDDDNDWDLRPHRGRVLRVDEERLERWRDLLEPPDTPALQTKSAYPVNSTIASVFDDLVGLERVGSLGLEISSGWHESGSQKAGYICTDWGPPDDWESVILQGPHFHVNTPFAKSPNETMRSNLDWSTIDLEALPAEAIPTTCFKPSGDWGAYVASYTHWGPEKLIAAREQFRVGWRRMASNTGERTLIPAIVPPGAAHVDAVFSFGFPDSENLELLAFVQGYLSSLVADLLIRLVPKNDIRAPAVNRLPLPPLDGALRPQIAVRAALLNCLTGAFAGVWESAVKSRPSLGWTGGLDYPARPTLGALPTKWGPQVPLRRASDRYQAQVEIDAAVALSLGIDAETLCTIYRTAFPVLRRKDQQKRVYDADGRLVPDTVRAEWQRRGDAIGEEALLGFRLPFQSLDREAAIRSAYRHFEELVSNS